MSIDKIEGLPLKLKEQVSGTRKGGVSVICRDALSLKDRKIFRKESE